LPLSHPRQGTPNTRLENYIQLHRAAPTTIGKNKKTLHFKVFQQTARARSDRKIWADERKLAAAGETPPFFAAAQGEQGFRHADTPSHLVTVANHI
jgi:hypothetical protein